MGQQQASEDQPRFNNFNSWELTLSQKMCRQRWLNAYEDQKAKQKKRKNSVNLTRQSYLGIESSIGAFQQSLKQQDLRGRQSVAFKPTFKFQKQQMEEECANYINVFIKVFVNDNQSVTIPIDLTSHQDINYLTSSWLQTRVFLQVTNHLSELDLNLDDQEPVCLSTLNNSIESVDYFLQKPDEPIVNYLSTEAVLKVVFCSKKEKQRGEKRESGYHTSIKDFDLIKVLGKGGFATVYMVRKRTTGKLYAMKAVKKNLVSGNDARFAQVLAERNILTQLHSPFIVQMHYAFTTKNYYCLVLDLCTGGELFYYIQKQQILPVREAKILLAEVISAIEFLHNSHVMYRDLKPENILVDEHGHLKLTDFGLCKPDIGPDDETTSYVGSPEYMSPEILSGLPYGYSVDFYTLGVLLYEMLVGRPPHYSEDRRAMYENIINKKPIIPEYLPPDARDLLAKLLEINPQLRIGSSGGISEIKQHKFFSDLDWIDLHNKKPVCGRKRPPLQVDITSSNFDFTYTEAKVDINVEEEGLSQDRDPALVLAQIQKKVKRSNSACQILSNPAYRRTSKRQSQRKRSKRPLNRVSQAPADLTRIPAPETTETEFKAEATVETESRQLVNTIMSDQEFFSGVTNGVTKNRGNTVKIDRQQVTDSLKISTDEPAEDHVFQYQLPKTKIQARAHRSILMPHSEDIVNALSQFDPEQQFQFRLSPKNQDPLKIKTAIERSKTVKVVKGQETKEIVVRKRETIGPQTLNLMFEVKDYSKIQAKQVQESSSSSEFMSESSKSNDVTQEIDPNEVMGNKPRSSLGIRQPAQPAQSQMRKTAGPQLINLGQTTQIPNIRKPSYSISEQDVVSPQNRGQSKQANWSFKKGGQSNRTSQSSQIQSRQSASSNASKPSIESPGVRGSLPPRPLRGQDFALIPEIIEEGVTEKSDTSSKVTSSLKSYSEFTLDNQNQMSQQDRRNSFDTKDAVPLKKQNLTAKKVRSSREVGMDLFIKEAYAFDGNTNKQERHKSDFAKTRDGGSFGKELRPSFKSTFRNLSPRSTMKSQAQGLRFTVSNQQLRQSATGLLRTSGVSNGLRFSQKQVDLRASGVSKLSTGILAYNDFQAGVVSERRRTGQTTLKGSPKQPIHLTQLSEEQSSSSDGEFDEAKNRRTSVFKDTDFNMTEVVTEDFGFDVIQIKVSKGKANKVKSGKVKGGRVQSKPLSMTRRYERDVSSRLSKPRAFSPTASAGLGDMESSPTETGEDLYSNRIVKLEVSDKNPVNRNITGLQSPSDPFLLTGTYKQAITETREMPIPTEQSFKIKRKMTAAQTAKTSSRKQINQSIFSAVPSPKQEFKTSFTTQRTANSVLREPAQNNKSTSALKIHPTKSQQIRPPSKQISLAPTPASKFKPQTRSFSKQSLPRLQTMFQKIATTKPLQKKKTPQVHKKSVQKPTKTFVLDTSQISSQTFLGKKSLGFLKEENKEKGLLAKSASQSFKSSFHKASHKSLHSRQTSGDIKNPMLKTKGGVRATQLKIDVSGLQLRKPSTKKKVVKKSTNNYLGDSKLRPLTAKNEGTKSLKLV